MGRGEIPVELSQQPSGFAFLFILFNFYQIGGAMQEKNLPQNTMETVTTYQISGRSFVVQSVFKKETTNTIGTILLRLMQADSENKTGSFPG